MTKQFAALTKRFPNKRAFITGAGNGLGVELAKALASDGWSLGLFDRNVERLAAIDGELSAAGVTVQAYPGDVTHGDELTVAVNSFASSHDGLDVMINNAGVAGAGSFMEISPEDWRWILEINFMGAVHGCRAAIPHLQRNGTGLLINVASAAAFVCGPNMSSYNCSKAALLALSESLAAELGPATQVSVAMPAFFQSGLLESFRGPDHLRAYAERAMTLAEQPTPAIARDILKAAAAGRNYIVLPRSARILWRIKRWLPNDFRRRVIRLRG